MSVYSSGVDAYRDTTKWLSAFVPVASLITAGLVVGPEVVTTIERATSVEEWLTQNWLLLGCLVALFGGIAAILWSGAQVLSVEPKDLGDLWLTAEGRSSGKSLAKVITAIGNGAAAPYFYDVETIERSMAQLANAFDNNKADEVETGLKRLEPAVVLVREWSVFSQSQQPFTRFRWVFVGSSIAIAIALCVAPTQLASSAKVDKPTPVEVEVDTAGGAELARATACSDPAGTIYTAIGGTWSQPQLAVDGPGCAFGATWWPEPDHIELRLPVSTD